MERGMCESCIQADHDKCVGHWLRSHHCSCPCHKPAATFAYDTVEDFVRAFKRAA
jgi:hypothetical protein